MSILSRQCTAPVDLIHRSANMKAMKFFWNCSARLALIAFLLIACTTARLNAQGYGTISGTASDPSGAVVASATVTATQTQTGREMVVVTSKDGGYVFPSLPPTTYSLSVSASGFQILTQTNISLQANRSERRVGKEFR